MHSLCWKYPWDSLNFVTITSLSTSQKKSNRSTKSFFVRKKFSCQLSSIWISKFQRDDAVFFVLPSATQQASFTALVIVAFLLKTLDVLQLIIRQSKIDIFFMDWEKSKTGESIDWLRNEWFSFLGYKDDVPIWRSCFVANEFHELQTFRRINLTFHLLFVLFFLKVNDDTKIKCQKQLVIFSSTRSSIWNSLLLHNRTLISFQRLPIFKLNTMEFFVLESLFPCG